MKKINGLDHKIKKVPHNLSPTRPLSAGVPAGAAIVRQYLASAIRPSEMCISNTLATHWQHNSLLRQQFPSEMCMYVCCMYACMHVYIYTVPQERDVRVGGEVGARKGGEHK